MSYQDELTRAYGLATGTGFKPIFCPGNTCKLCSLIHPVLNFKDKHTQEQVDLAYKIRAKHQHFANICFDPDYSKVILFAFGKQIMDDLVKYQMDPVNNYYKDFAHPTMGRLMVITKVIGTNGRPQYSVTPTPQVHQLPTLGMQPHNLVKVIELLDQGEDYLPQSKLDVKSVPIRIIGFGPDQTRFFRTYKIHWGMGKDEFESIQHGQYNPFALEDLECVEPALEYNPADDKNYDTEEDIPFDISDAAPLGKGHPFVAKAEPTDGVELPVTPSNPPCYGLEFDPEDVECQECKTWKVACRDSFLERYGA